jgi:hypothetical protein
MFHVNCLLVGATPMNCPKVGPAHRCACRHGVAFRNLMLGSVCVCVVGRRYNRPAKRCPMLTDALVTLIVVAAVAYVWIVRPIMWFRGGREQPLPDQW